MSAITNFTVKSLRANKVRTLVTIGGIVLAAALLTAVLTSYTSLQSLLYRGTEEVSGSWMAMAYSDDGRDSLEAQAASAQTEGLIGETALIQDAGFGQLTERQQDIYGRYLPIADITGGVEKLCGLRPSEGRLPEKPGEILLFDTWRTSGGLEVGDTLTLPVGQRAAMLAPGQAGSMSQSPDMPAAMLEEGEWATDAMTEISEGTLLDSSMGYLEADADGGIFNERLVEAEERTYTVVGFFAQIPYVASRGVGITAFTSDDPAAAGYARLFTTMSDVSSTDVVEERMNAAFPEAEVRLHKDLLRYMGVRSGGAIWDTFFGIVAVLAAVIVVACVSLIYNAFAISVAERISQFGLLASVGASRRQLRRAVVLEALIVAVIGIPIGLLVGIGGCAVTFIFVGPALAMLMGAEGVPFVVSVAPWALAFSASLTLVTVLVSAFVPAWRASRISVVEALRGTRGGRVSKRGVKAAAKAVMPGKLWKPRGMVDRIFGIGGTLAHINEKRGTGRGTAASVSLALAIVLLMTAGSLSTFLGKLSDVAGGTVDMPDVSISAALVATVDASSDPEAVVAAANERFAKDAELFGATYDSLLDTPGAVPRGWILRGSAPIMLPEEMADTAILDHEIEAGPRADGRCGAMAGLVFLDDATFDAYAAEQGIDAAAYHDAAHPRAIGVAEAYGNNGDVYQLFRVFRSTGMVEVIEGGIVTTDGGARRPIEVFTSGYYGTGEDGGSRFNITPYYTDEQGNTVIADDDISSDQVTVVSSQLEIAALADAAPSLMGNAWGLKLIMPMSLASTTGFGIMSPSFEGFFDAANDAHAEVAQALVDEAGTFLHAHVADDVSYLMMNDFAERFESNRTLALVVNVFCLLFTVILALIAMGNVFNTVTNSLILRRREFAVMRSVGLSGRQFRRMIVDECVGFGLRGFVPGILVATVVSWLLYCVVTNSMTGLVFALPWTYVALALGMTVAAMLVSVAYGMHRCKADNVVEVLRADNA